MARWLRNFSILGLVVVSFTAGLLLGGWPAGHVALAPGKPITPEAGVPDKFDLFRVSVVIATESPEDYLFIRKKFGLMHTMVVADQSVRAASLGTVYGIYDCGDELRYVRLADDGSRESVDLGKSWTDQ